MGKTGYQGVGDLLNPFRVILAGVVLAGFGLAEDAQAQIGNQAAAAAAHANLFNYYVGPGQGAYMAEMYPAPRPVPPLVGRTFITYQPLAPHHFLEPHKMFYTRGNRYTYVQYFHRGSGPVRDHWEGPPYTSFPLWAGEALHYPSTLHCPYIR